jgi:hypothetical protein
MRGATLQPPPPKPALTSARLCPSSHVQTQPICLQVWMTIGTSPFSTSQELIDRSATVSQQEKCRQKQPYLLRYSTESSFLPHKLKTSTAPSSTTLVTCKGMRRAQNGLVKKCSKEERAMRAQDSAGLLIWEWWVWLRTHPPCHQSDTHSPPCSECRNPQPRWCTPPYTALPLYRRAVL